MANDEDDNTEIPRKRPRVCKINQSRIRVLEKIRKANNNENQPPKANKTREKLKLAIQKAQEIKQNREEPSSDLDQQADKTTWGLSRKFMDEIMYETVWYAAHRYEAQSNDPRQPPRSSIEPNILDVTEGVFNYAMDKLQQAGFHPNHVLNFLSNRCSVLPGKQTKKPVKINQKDHEKYYILPPKQEKPAEVTPEEEWEPRFIDLSKKVDWIPIPKRTRPREDKPTDAPKKGSENKKTPTRGKRKKAESEDDQPQEDKQTSEEEAPQEEEELPSGPEEEQQAEEDDQEEQQKEVEDQQDEKTNNDSEEE